MEEHPGGWRGPLTPCTFLRAMIKAVLRQHPDPQTIRINPEDFAQFGGELRTMEECLTFPLVADPAVPARHVTVSDLEEGRMLEEEPEGLIGFPWGEEG